MKYLLTAFALVFQKTLLLFLYFFYGANLVAKGQCSYCRGSNDFFQQLNARDDQRLVEFKSVCIGKHMKWILMPDNIKNLPGVKCKLNAHYGFGRAKANVKQLCFGMCVALLLFCFCEE